MTRLHKLILVFVTACLLISFLPVSLAEPAKINVDSGTLNMRKKPDSKSGVVDRIPKGKIVEVDEIDDEWSHVTYKGQGGYVLTKYLLLASGMVGQDVYSDGETLYVRESMDDNAPIIMVVSAKEAVHVISVDGEWACVSCNGKTGYILSSTISNQNTKPENDSTYIVNEQGLLLHDQTMYAEPNSNSTAVGSLLKGWSVTVKTFDKGWALVASGSTYGFVPTASIQLTGADIIDPLQPFSHLSDYVASFYTATTAEQQLTLYSAPTADLSDVWKTVAISAGESFKVLERAHDDVGYTWSRIWLPDGTIGWVLASTLHFSDTMSEYHYADEVNLGAYAVAYVKEGGARIHEGASVLTPVIGTIPAGTEVQTYVSDVICKVTYNGITGYVSVSELTFGFAMSGDWQNQKDPTEINPEPTATPEAMAEIDFISAEMAKKNAVKALKKAYSRFDQSKYNCAYDITANNAHGVPGTNWRFAFTNADGQYMYLAYVNALTGDVVFTADYSGFAYAADDIRTTAPATPKPQATKAPDEISKAEARTIADNALAGKYGGFSSASFTNVQSERYKSKPGYNDPFYQFTYYCSNGDVFIAMIDCKSGRVVHTEDNENHELTEIDYNTPEPTATPAAEKMSEGSARSIGERFLSSKYAAFSGTSFARKTSSYQEEDPYIKSPYYVFNYFVEDPNGGTWPVLAFSVCVHAVTGEIVYYSSDMPGSGNG